MSDWCQDPGATYTLVRIESDNITRLDGLCDGLGKSRAEVVEAALYFFEQSLLYDPCTDMEVCKNGSKEV